LKTLGENLKNKILYLHQYPELKKFNLSILFSAIIGGLSGGMLSVAEASA